jgi:hypothetical protein
MNTYNGFTNYTTQRVADDLAIRGIDYTSFANDDAQFVDHPDLCDEYELAEAIRKKVDELICGDVGIVNNGLGIYYARLFVADCNWVELAQYFIDNQVDEIMKMEEYFAQSGR